MNDPRRIAGDELCRALHEAREATLAASLDLSDAQWRPPYHPGLQPTAWDLAHIAWFAEFWMLRGPHRLGIDANVHADAPATFVARDEVYDSARIGHRARWEIDLLPRALLLERMAAQLAACVAAVRSGTGSDDDLYHARFSLFHELMHHEALVWTRAIQALPAPPGVVLPRIEKRGEVAHRGGEVRIGCTDGTPGFAFDNERPGRRVTLQPFAIDRSPVSNGQFLEFVQAGGYDRPEFWPGASGVWRARTKRSFPERWRRTARGAFEQRWFDAWLPLDPDQPVIHVNAWEAEAWCAFAGRALPTAAEWECAAPELCWGNMVWEWTADAFAPYSGFRPAPYHTYSAPWFHWQRELRGGAFATHARMHDRRYRNFFLPQRTDVFAGFRSVAR
jgi:ergothioneine biosynthesis protein EgtB